MTVLNGTPQRVEDVTLDGIDVYVRVVTVGEMKKIEAIGAQPEAGNLDKMVAFFLFGACAGDGRRLYSDEQTATVENLPWTAVQRTAEAVIEINGLAAEEDDTAGN